MNDVKIQETPHTLGRAKACFVDKIPKWASFFGKHNPEEICPFLTPHVSQNQSQPIPFHLDRVITTECHCFQRASAWDSRKNLSMGFGVPDHLPRGPCLERRRSGDNLLEGLLYEKGS